MNVLVAFGLGVATQMVLAKVKFWDWLIYLLKNIFWNKNKPGDVK